MTEMTAFQREISRFLPHIKLKINEPLSGHTSFRIGGDAEVMAFPSSAEQLAQLLKFARERQTACRILGAGTNVLAPDEALPGLVICLKNALMGKEKTGEGSIRIFAGESMVAAALFAAELGLSGLEFAHGIPGTVGGGVYMNAGAYGSDISAVCTRVGVMDTDGNRQLLSNGEMAFSYRNSRVQRDGSVVLFADFTLQKQPKVAIMEKMQELKAKRTASQPLDKLSAGSAFKRPAVGYAAQMIDEAGLKGFRIGGAAVSEKHAGFVVNLGGATAADVRRVLDAVICRVEEQKGVRLEPEIRIW